MARVRAGPLADGPAAGQGRRADRCRAQSGCSDGRQLPATLPGRRGRRARGPPSGPQETRVRVRGRRRGRGHAAGDRRGDRRLDPARNVPALADRRDPPADARRPGGQAAVRADPLPAAGQAHPEHAHLQFGHDPQITGPCGQRVRRRVSRRRGAPGWHPAPAEAAERIDASTLFPVAVRRLEPAEPWTTTRVTLLDDAIHAMPPGFGAGANSALRDAPALTRALTAAVHGSREPANGRLRPRWAQDGDAVAERGGVLVDLLRVRRQCGGAQQFPVMLLQLREGVDGGSGAGEGEVDPDVAVLDDETARVPTRAAFRAAAAQHDQVEVAHRTGAGLPQEPDLLVGQAELPGNRAAQPLGAQHSRRVGGYAAQASGGGDFHLVGDGHVQGEGQGVQSGQRQRAPVG
ncbi:FAD-dependent oxidoreductase [Streptomyces olindensis]|uniref:FAD-dependent oxidoreductase n=1 Tax=Streptomyces olindensis TaxID=358823 RepID=UPI0036C03E6F